MNSLFAGDLFGMRVIVSENVPKLHVGDEIRPLMPHPLVQWAFRKLRIPVYPVCFLPGAKIEEDQALMTPAGLVMSAAMFAGLRRKLR